jgi:hypothetical protein
MALYGFRHSFVDAGSGSTISRSGILYADNVILQVESPNQLKSHSIIDWVRQFNHSYGNIHNKKDSGLFIEERDKMIIIAATKCP